jgi:PAS domain S-box-containing protein
MPNPSPNVRPTQTLESTSAIEFMERVMASAQVAICVFDSAGRFAMLSPRGAEVTGYPADELRGKPSTFLVVPADKPRIRKLIESVLTSGESFPQTETTITCKDGAQKLIRFDMGPIREGEKIVGAVATGEDISTIRRAEEAIRRSSQELRLLSSRLLDLQDAERRRIARELHDVTAQNLFAIHIALGRLLPQSSEAQRSELQECIALCEQSREEIRTLSYLLHPPMLDEAGLVAALKWYVGGFSARTGIKVRLDSDHYTERLPIDVETDLFRVVQECLANVHRHSGSRTASVELQRGNENVTLTVQDWGHGMPREVRHRRNLATVGVGIPGMRERVGQHRGRLEIKSGPKGTRITATIPYSARPRRYEPGSREMSEESA